MRTLKILFLFACLSWSGLAQQTITNVNTGNTSPDNLQTGMNKVNTNEVFLFGIAAAAQPTNSLLNQWLGIATGTNATVPITVALAASASAGWPTTWPLTSITGIGTLGSWALLPTNIFAGYDLLNAWKQPTNGFGTAVWSSTNGNAGTYLNGNGGWTVPVGQTNNTLIAPSGSITVSTSAPSAGITLYTIGSSAGGGNAVLSANQQWTGSNDYTGPTTFAIPPLGNGGNWTNLNGGSVTGTVANATTAQQGPSGAFGTAAYTASSSYDASGAALNATNPVPTWIQNSTNPVPTWIANSTNGLLTTAQTVSGNWTLNGGITFGGTVTLNGQFNVAALYATNFVAGTNGNTNIVLSGTTGAQTNTGPIYAPFFAGNGINLTNLSNFAIFNLFEHKGASDFSMQISPRTNLQSSVAITNNTGSWADCIALGEPPGSLTNNPNGFTDNYGIGIDCGRIANNVNSFIYAGWGICAGASNINSVACFGDNGLQAASNAVQCAILGNNTFLVAASVTNATSVGDGNGGDCIGRADGDVFLGSQNASTGQSITGTNLILLGYNLAVPSQSDSGQLSIANVIFGRGLTNCAVSTSPANGKIGILTNSPQYALHVNGTIRGDSGLSGSTITNSGLTGTAYLATDANGKIVAAATPDASGAGTTAAQNATNGITSTFIQNKIGAGVYDASGAALNATNALNAVPYLTLSGSASGSTYLRGDGAWATPAGSGDVTKAGQNNFTGSNYTSGAWTFAANAYFSNAIYATEFDIQNLYPTNVQLTFASSLVGVNSSSNLSAATAAQINSAYGQTILTNGHSAAVTISNNVTVDAAHYIVGAYFAPTNVFAAAALTAGQAYTTNLSANLTLTAFVSVPNNMLWSIYLLATNSSVSTYTITFPGGCVGQGQGTPPVYYVTNGTRAEFQINGWGTIATNVNWSPHW